MLRNLREPQAKLTCLDSFNRIAPYVDDEVRLQRLVPFAVSLLAADSRDQSALVRAQAIKTLSNVMSLVRTFPASDAHIFPEYILPILNSVNEAEAEELVLQAYAESLPKLADTARRFLETSQFFKQKQPLKDSTGVPDAKSSVRSFLFFFFFPFESSQHSAFSV
jgi:phosphoinositide-3-kinase regulatory subunit 4